MSQISSMPPSPNATIDLMANTKTGGMDFSLKDIGIKAHGMTAHGSMATGTAAHGTKEHGSMEHGMMALSKKTQKQKAYSHNSYLRKFHPNQKENQIKHSLSIMPPTKTINNAHITATVSKGHTYNDFFRIWQSGTWYDGVWKGRGEWLNGIWLSGTWISGTWHIRELELGMYGPEGQFYQGIWVGGEWLNGNWKEGTIVNKYNSLTKFTLVSPKATLKPKSTLSLNYAKYF